MPVQFGVTHTLARIAIPKLFAQGYSATRALSFYKTIAPGIRKTDWLGYWREITGAKKLERAYRFIPKKYALSYQMIAPTETFQTKKYKYIFDVSGYDEATGALTTRTASMTSDGRLSPFDSETEMFEALEEEAEFYLDTYGFIPESVSLKAVYRKI